jgi:predicted PurR-regulated permease PerM
MTANDRAVGWHSKDVARAAALVMAMYLGIKLLWFANQLVLVTFLGVLFGLAVEAGVDKLERFKIRRGIGAAIIVVTFFALLTGVGAWLTPTIREQSVELRAKIPEAVDRIEQWLSKRQSGFFGFMFGGQGGGAKAGDTTALTSTDSARTRPGARPGAARDTAQAAADSSRAAQPTPDSSEAAQGGTPSAGETLRSSLGRQLGGASRFLFPFLTHTVAVFGGIMLIIFMSIYIAADPSLYHRGLMHLFPHRMRDRAGGVLSAMAVVLRRWLVTQLIAMLVIGAVTTIALLILRVKAAFALGLIAGLLEFIPTIGPILSAAPAIAMGFLDSPEKALTVALVYVGVQFMENHLLIPLLMKGGVDVPPVLTILGQALMTIVFGFLGLMVAVPMLAATMVAVKMLYVERVVGDEIAVVNKSEDPRAGGPPPTAKTSSG